MPPHAVLPCSFPATSTPSLLSLSSPERAAHFSQHFGSLRRPEFGDQAASTAQVSLCLLSFTCRLPFPTSAPPLQSLASSERAAYFLQHPGSLGGPEFGHQGAGESLSIVLHMPPFPAAPFTSLPFPHNVCSSLSAPARERRTNILDLPSSRVVHL